MSGALQTWTCVTIWIATAGVLVTTGVAGLALAAAALACGGYRAYADGIVVPHGR